MVTSAKIIYSFCYILLRVFSICSIPIVLGQLSNLLSKQSVMLSAVKIFFFGFPKFEIGTHSTLLSLLIRFVFKLLQGIFKKLSVLN